MNTTAATPDPGLSGQSATVLHALRLLPRQDLREALEHYTREMRLPAGVIVTCAGSLDRVVFRPAGQTGSLTLEGPHEIVSLTGTLSQDGPHLHMAVSNAQGATIGGHVLAGCRIYTTAEIGILVPDALKFRRAEDVRTGFSELFIDAPAMAGSKE